MTAWPAIVENCVTLIACAAIVVGLYALGAGGWAGCGFILLLNLNYFTRRKKND